MPNVAPADSVLFTYIGYKSQTLVRGLLSDMVVELVEDDQLLEEIVVVGYGTQRKSDLTGSVSSLRGADLAKIPSLSPEQALQGKIAGVQINSVSGAPGATPAVRIRGVGTLNNSAPIYVVDGVILDDISFLNSNDIESMEILKDASATFIYGSRGANGVVLVTTKRAKSGAGGSIDPVINVSSEYSVQHLQKKMDLLTPRQFANVVNQISPGLLAGQLGATNWQDEIFNQMRPIYSFHAGVTGPSARNNYYFGLGYFSHDGIIDKSDYKRLSLKINDSYSITNNIKVGANCTVSPDYKNNEAGVVAMAYRAWPTSVPFNADGSFAEVQGAGNPLAAIEYYNSYTSRIRGVGNIFTDINFLKHFTFRSSFGQDYSHVKNKSFTPAYFVSSSQSNSLSDLNVSSIDYFTWLWENTLNYNQDFGKHDVDALAGYTSQKFTTETIGASIQSLVGNDPALWYLQSGDITYLTANNTGEITTLVSSLFRLNYSFNDKYLLTASVRRDGSSKFGRNNRYGTFPSFAAGWNIHNEDFFKSVKSISKLKLRASWGIIGNEKIPWSRQYSLVNNDQNAVFNETFYPWATYGRSGRVKEEYINHACRLILNAKYDLGLFDNPYKYIHENRNKMEMMSPDKLALSREIAAKSCVLLKNENDVLPLQKDQKIAFFCPFIDDQRNLIGNWSGAGDWKQAVSIRNSLTSKYPQNKFLFAKGCNIMEDELLRKRLNDHDGRIEMDTQSADQLITEAVQIAGQADVVVVALGETFGMSGEAACRTDIRLLENQRRLLEALVKTNKQVVLVLMNGRPLDLSWEDANVTAILEIWFAGSQAGHAITDVLFGDVNPSGKLTMTFPRNVGQVPIYYNAKNTGRPFDPSDKYTSKYLDVANIPLYPFGYGLSYTSFQYSGLTIDKQALRNNVKLVVTVDVKNTGKRAGEEIVQLYIRDLVGSITRPVKELKGFRKISLNPGQSTRVSFELTADDLTFYNAQLKLVTEPGEFEVFAGSHSATTDRVSFRFE